MDKPHVGKREHNKATMKLQIMETFIKAMESQPLDALRVEDLCKDIGISKVTFFNYFASKEQIIEYFIANWQYNICYVLSKGELQGIDGMKHIYHSVADHKAGPNIMITLMQYYLSHSNSESLEVTPYEYYLFNPDAYTAGVEYMSLPEIMAKLLSDFPIPKDNVMPTVLNLISGFYGVAFVIHIAGQYSDKDKKRDDLKKAYDRFVDAMLS